MRIDFIVYDKQATSKINELKLLRDLKTSSKILSKYLNLKK
jgi:hypothetical protein